MNGVALRDVRVRPRWILLSAGLALAIVAASVVAGPRFGAVAASGAFPIGVPNDQTRGIRPPAFIGTPPAGDGFTNQLPGIDLNVVAATLGISVGQLRNELATGSTLRAVIAAHGSSVDAVAGALVGAAKVQLDQQVAAGSLTAGQELQQLATLRRQYQTELGR